MVTVESNFFKLKLLKYYLILSLLKDTLNDYIILYSKRLEILLVEL